GARGCSGRLTLRCRDHGFWRTTARVGPGSARRLEPDEMAFHMPKQERLCLLTHASALMLASGQGASIMIAVGARCCEYIILEHEGDVVQLQLGSREWDCRAYGH